MWQYADVPPTPIDPSGTELYYTMSVWDVEECRHTQVRCTTSPSWTLVVQSPTTPCQFDMWQHAHIPRSDVPHPLITPSGTELYYTMSVSHVEQCRCTMVRCTPPANWTQCYRAKLHHVSLICGRMQKYPGQMYTPTQVIKPSATEPYFTMSVWHVAMCRCTQVRCTPTPTHPTSRPI